MPLVAPSRGGHSEEGSRLARIAVIGAGYVGLVLGVGLAASGHRVRVGERDADRVASLSDGDVPFYEPDLDGMLRSALDAGTIGFTTDNAAAARDADAVFVAVPTPPGAGGLADTRAVDGAVSDVLPVMGPHALLVIKSTVPVGTIERIQLLADQAGRGTTVLSNPEFLRAGHAVEDFFAPSRTVIGGEPDAARRLAAMFPALGDDLVITDPVSAELIKYGANAFLAIKVSYANELAALSGALGGDSAAVLRGVAGDPRIGPAAFAPGPGFGGSCLPKDSAALVQTARAAGSELQLVGAALEVNRVQRRRNLARVLAALDGQPEPAVGIWGLAFKARTDDVRESPALWLLDDLAAAGVAVQAFDELVRLDDDRFRRCADPVEAAKDVDVLVIATEEASFREVDLGTVGSVMRGRTIVDLRRILDAAAVEAAGLDLVV